LYVGLNVDLVSPISKRDGAGFGPPPLIVLHFTLGAPVVEKEETVQRRIPRGGAFFKR
jgi:hypothetical protein